MTPLNVLNVHRGQDTGGQGWRTFAAFRQHAPDWTYRAAFRPNAFEYIEYPQDLTWWDVPAAWKAADVVHLHNNFDTALIYERLRGGKKKPAIIHYHGTQFRENPLAVLDEQRRRGIVGVVSTLDLIRISPGALLWLPSPYDLDWLAGLRSLARAA